ncbi:O-glucosyltransferase rumi-like [Tripterygium wilfordii]|uniref:O-glucosyltransferase rumi-like n=1 Tax=Tripterygium wilfordii TaxID=458696 RepID=A0A7J7CG73_TRIWF|nr:O-glucosyltransferase rumi-like [Tripterygium wilfordii]
MKTRSSITIVLFFFFISLFIGVVTVFWINDYVAEDWFASNTSLPGSTKKEYTRNCSSGNVTRTCPTTRELNQSSATTCPEYFQWIHEDLRPWQRTGISRAMLEGGQDVAHFRLVIVGGRVYVKKYKKVFQTRDVFTIWGIVQLTRLYPGMLPDLELLFYCGDKTAIKKRNYHEGSNPTSPPPVFHYCGDDDSLDIVFPDWSFWGWAEINVRPWKSLLEDIKEGNKRINWKDRLPYAYWKGNARVGGRADLMKCNVSDKYDWNGRFYLQARTLGHPYICKHINSVVMDLKKLNLESKEITQGFVIRIGIKKLKKDTRIPDYKINAHTGKSHDFFIIF